MVDLLPCPFCGGDAKVIEGEESAYVQCMDMSMHRAIWFSGDNTAADQVSEQWNTRATTARIAALEGACKAARTELRAHNGEGLHPSIDAVIDQINAALASTDSMKGEAQP